MNSGRILPLSPSTGSERRFMRTLLTCTCSFLAAATLAAVAAPPGAPDVDQILSLQRAASPEISPDGRWIAYTVRETNWEDNAYETEIWLADTRTGTTRQLTNARQSSLSPAWSPDSTTLAFVSDRTDKRQIYVINPLGGEAHALTSAEDGVNAFAWAPDGKRIAYTSTDPKSAAAKDRDKKYGEFRIVDQEHRMSHLHVATSRHRRRGR
jgi:dipeptidyl aminopeptidase/acylaminoacyl peptidase